MIDDIGVQAVVPAPIGVRSHISRTLPSPEVREAPRCTQAMSLSGVGGLSMTSLDEVLRRVAGRSGTYADLVYLQQVIAADRAATVAASRAESVDRIVDALLLAMRDEDVSTFDPPGPLDLLCIIGDTKVMTGLAVLAADTTVYPVNRMEAARSLGALGRIGEAGDALISLSAEELPSNLGWLRIASAVAAAGFGREDEAVGILLALAADSELDIGVRVDSAASAYNLGHGSPASTILAELADGDSIDNSARVRAAVAAARGSLPDEATRRLRKLAHIYLPFPDLRKEIALALIEAGDKQAGLTILQRMAEDRHPNGHTRVECAVAISEYGSGDSAAAALLTILRDPLGIHDEAYRQAARALADIRGRTAADALQALARDTDTPAEARLKAALTLHGLGRRTTATRVILSLSKRVDIEAPVRLAAAQSLRELGHVVDTVPVLVSLACNENLDDGTRWSAFDEMYSVADRATCATVLRSLAHNILMNHDRAAKVAQAMIQLGLFEDLVGEIRHPGVFGVSLVASNLAEAGCDRELRSIISDSELGDNIRVAVAREVLWRRPDSPMALLLAGSQAIWCHVFASHKHR